MVQFYKLTYCDKFWNMEGYMFLKSIDFTGYPDATNAVGDNHRAYKQWRHGNIHAKKTSNSSSILRSFGMLFCTVYIEWHLF